jgi:hypothetical protein
MDQNDLDGMVKQIRGFLDCSQSCRKLFDEAVIHGLSAQRTKTLFSEPTIYNKLSVLENAINVTQESCNKEGSKCNHRDLTVSTFPLLFKVLRRLTQQSENKVSENKPIQGPSTSKVDFKPEKKINKSTSPAIPPPSGEEAEQIYKDVISKFSKGHPLSYFKHITCNSKSCEYCKDLFFNVDLSLCVGHKPCVPGRWYPHVGRALWTQLLKKHNSGEKYAYSKKTALRNNCMPSLAIFQSQQRLNIYSTTPDEPELVDSVTSQADANASCASMDTNVLEISASYGSWAEEVPLLKMPEALQPDERDELNRLRTLHTSMSSLSFGAKRNRKSIGSPPKKKKQPPSSKE